MLCCSVSTADTVTLRAAATIAHGQPLRLADAADVQGDATPGDTVILDADAVAKRGGNGKGGFTLSVADLRRALGSVEGVNLGRVAISGSSVRVQVGEPATLQAAHELPQAVPVPAGDTLGSVLPGALARWLGIDEQDVLLDTKGVDDGLLATTLVNRTYAVSSSSRGDVLPVQVRVFEGDKPVLTQTIRVGVKVRRLSCVAARDIARAEVLAPADFRAEDTWVPTGTSPALAADVPGATARSAIKAGAVIEERQVERPPTIERGDLVSVDCIAGTVVLRATMRAREAGRVGDIIWLEPLAKPAARTPTTAVRARVAAPGRAVTTGTPSVSEGVSETVKSEE